MNLMKKSVFLLVVFGMFFVSVTSAHASMVSTSEVLSQTERAQLADMLEREDVKNQLIEMGVDPASALMRIEQMTDEELVQINGKLAELPAGAGISTTDLLLIIILVILLF